MISKTYFTTFFFQAEDGIRVHCVTGVQTCALPISAQGGMDGRLSKHAAWHGRRASEIGRASCRERVWISAVAVALKKKLSKGEIGSIESSYSRLASFHDGVAVDYISVITMTSKPVE